jgi:hypothetical protein
LLAAQVNCIKFRHGLPALASGDAHALFLAHVAACAAPTNRPPCNTKHTTHHHTGQSNLSCFTSGMMGYRTPNIDSIADEGIRFTGARVRAM